MATCCSASASSPATSFSFSDNGYFSEFGTFSITDWIGHAPKPLLAKNFGVPEAVFDSFPKQEVWLLSQVPHGIFQGGREWRADANHFPISTTVTGVILELDPGALRVLHWHPNPLQTAGSDALATIMRCQRLRSCHPERKLN
jgi:oxalate decarboxylase